MGDFQAPIHKEMAECINDCSDGLSRLYAQEYQARRRRRASARDCMHNQPADLARVHRLESSTSSHTCACHMLTPRAHAAFTRVASLGLVRAAVRFCRTCTLTWSRWRARSSSSRMRF